ncbi:MAG: D-glycero-beta-D-manno-heptose 1-phosphate adenylyltransferase [Mycobacteriaceae bacterium]|nr:D-glycero-beta-D-manno-heptose 1-phosphate adenylyltransferase [Mycobacteriaceae bacterium]
MIGTSPPRVVVLGDSVLDVWLSGTCHRLCREGPAPVVEVDGSSAAPGAAANTAANLAALGARVDIVTVVGDDDVGAELLDQLRGHGVGTAHVVTAPGWATPCKERIVAAGQVLLRCDRGTTGGSGEAAQLASHLAAALKNADALVISDYSGECADRRVLAELNRLRPMLPLLVVDAHDLSPWRGLRADLIVPDEAESASLLADCGTPPAGSARAQFFANHRHRLLSASGATTAAVTLDRDGVLLLDGDKPAYRTHTRAARPQNCSGAGDTFTAAMTIGLARGMSAIEAAHYGQLAADVVTAQPGTSVCTAAELERRADPASGPLISHDELAHRTADHRLAGRRIVFTNGCFDVLHRGHVSYLTEAKAAGDVLIVAINSDSGVRRLKGPERPINAEGDRAAVLSALSCVDHVTAFDGDTPIPLIQRLQPDIYVKGGDYSVEMLAEAAVVEGYGGEVRILGYVADHSTTETIQRIRSVDPRESAASAGRA